MPHDATSRKRTKRARKLISEALTGNRNASKTPAARRIQICASVAPETHSAIRTYAEQHKVSAGKAIDAIVALTIRNNSLS